VTRKPDLDAELRLFPKLTRFYGMSARELSRTPRWLLTLYIEQMAGLEAEEQLDAIQVATAPYGEQADLDSTIRRLRRAARRLYAETAAATTEAKPAQAAAPDRARLSAMGIALVKEPPKASKEDAA
jgi:hypothetical protein